MHACMHAPCLKSWYRPLYKVHNILYLSAVRMQVHKYLRMHHAEAISDIHQNQTTPGEHAQIQENHHIEGSQILPHQTCHGVRQTHTPAVQVSVRAFSYLGSPTLPCMHTMICSVQLMNACTQEIVRWLSVHLSVTCTLFKCLRLQFSSVTCVIRALLTRAASQDMFLQVIRTKKMTLSPRMHHYFGVMK